jgi:hypothetical protein
VISGKGEGVETLEPAVVSIASIVGFSQLEHGFRFFYRKYSISTLSLAFAIFANR